MDRIEIIKFLLCDLLSPIMVSIIVTGLQYKWNLWERAMNKLPLMFTMKIESKEQLKRDKLKILSIGKIYKFSYSDNRIIEDDEVSELRKEIRIEDISYDDLKEEVAEEDKELFLMGFEWTSEVSVRLIRIVDKEGIGYELSGSPTYNNKEMAFGFVCDVKDSPMEIYGSSVDRKFVYKVDGAKVRWIRPRIEKGSR